MAASMSRRSMRAMSLSSWSPRCRRDGRRFGRRFARNHRRCIIWDRTASRPSNKSDRSVPDHEDEKRAARACREKSEPSRLLAPPELQGPPLRQVQLPAAAPDLATPAAPAPASPPRASPSAGTIPVLGHRCLGPICGVSDWLQQQGLFAGSRRAGDTLSAPHVVFPAAGLPDPPLPRLKGMQQLWHRGSSERRRGALRRASESERIAGNAVTLLCDGPQVFRSWLHDIERAPSASSCLRTTSSQATASECALPMP